MTTSIEWTKNADGSEGESWNPIRARNRQTGKVGHYCQRISPLCKNCYAASMNVWRGNGVDYTVPGLDQVELYLDEDALMQPFRWKKPRNIFVCSMTDLFAGFVPDDWLRKVYAIEAMAARHTFMHLTKRPERRRAFLSQFSTPNEWANFLSELREEEDIAAWSDDAECHIANAINGVLFEKHNVGWPMRNVREGTSVGTQEEADELIPITLQTPTALRWLSMEPILEDINISQYIGLECRHENSYTEDDTGATICRECEDSPLLDWVVVGGESGTSARPTNVDYIRGVVRQCQAANVPVFVKQLGRHPFQPRDADGVFVPDYEYRIDDAKGGDPEEWPEDLRVREMPEVNS